MGGLMSGSSPSLPFGGPAVVLAGPISQVEFSSCPNTALTMLIHYHPGFWLVGLFSSV
jgi:hypothetical protein